MEETSNREQILKIFDEIRQVMSKTLRKSLSDGTLFSAVNHSLELGFEELSDDERIQVTNNFVQGLTEFYEKESSAFIEYWKSHIPFEEELEAMSDDEATEKIFNPFIIEFEYLFHAIPQRFVESIQGK